MKTSPGRQKEEGRKKNKKKQGSFSLSLPVTDCKAIRHCPRTSVGACARQERGGNAGKKLRFPEWRSRPSIFHLAPFAWCSIKSAHRAPGTTERSEAPRAALERGTLLTPSAPPHLNTVLNKEREKEKKKEVRLNSPCFHNGVPLLDADKSESHKYPRAAEHRRFDLASQRPLFLKAQFKMHVYVGHDDGGRQ